MNYGNGRSLSVTYDNRLRPTRWSFGATQDYKYFYDYFNEHTANGDALQTRWRNIRLGLYPTKQENHGGCVPERRGLRVSRHL